MLKQIYKGSLWVLLLFGIGACSNEQLGDEPVPGNTPIQLSGALTRASGDGLLITNGNPLTEYSSANFYLSARIASGNDAYFSNMSMTIGNNQGSGRNNLNSQVYYPLGGTKINLYAHTGSVATGNPANTIPLVSGTDREMNDILFGKGTDEIGAVVSGSSATDDQIKFITFRHQMTKVKVKIEVTNDVENQKPTTINMTFNNSAIVSEGNLNMLTGAVTAGAQDYTLTGSVDGNIYYLVPTGKIISGTNMIKSLKIDDYTATDEDLANLTIQKTDEGNDFILSPGLAYDLTFKINRLKITEIKLTLKDWNIQGGTSEWGYEPKTLTLNTGGDYTVANDDSKITKMVLKYKHTDNNTYQYIGEGRWDGTENKIDFVTLPADLSAETLTADLYTKDGLLADNVEINPSGIDGLNVVNLGKYGMKKNGNVLEISTPLQFALMVNDGAKAGNQEYRLTKGLDMGNTAVSITPTTFPAGSVLDGAGHDILNLNINGNGLFTENQGTLKNFRIASGLIKGSGTDAIGAVCQTNKGQIEAVTNGANIEPASGQTIAGGICGINSTGGTIVAALNTGNVSGGTTVGGIVGNNQNITAGAITACLNVGMLNKGAATLGGIAGTSVSGTSIVNSCFWLTGTARKNQAVSGELAIGNNPADAAVNSADLVASVIRDAVTIDKLNTALTAILSSWEFKLDPNRSSWPIATKP